MKKKRRKIFKKTGIICCLAMTMFLSANASKAQNIPGIGPITGLVNRVIKAIDLKVQRLQNKTIALQNAQKVIENTMSKLHLQQITDWVQKQKDLYADYYQELWQVKSAITYYHRVKEIVQQQTQLVAAYQRA